MLKSKHTDTVIGAEVGPWTWSFNIELRASEDTGPLNVFTGKEERYN